MHINRIVSALWEQTDLMFLRTETAALYSCHKDNLAVWEFMVSNKRAQNLDHRSMTFFI